MIRLAAGLALVAAPSFAQFQPTDAPRAIDLFAAAQGYADMTPDRYGTPTSPQLNELGMVLVSRMFKNTCLGIESGAPIQKALPPGFSAYEDMAYAFGEDPTGNGGTMVLSPTGDIDIDDAQGHPTVRLTPHSVGMQCTLEWLIASDIPEDTQQHMGGYLTHWFPFEMALVRAERPSMTALEPVRDFTEWDRPCGDKWCPLTVNFDMTSGRITLTTVLNITDVEGSQP